jgi:hypothetical protein
LNKSGRDKLALLLFIIYLKWTNMRVPPLSSDEKIIGVNVNHKTK